jgi:hypothetical protein
MHATQQRANAPNARPPVQASELVAPTAAACAWLGGQRRARRPGRQMGGWIDQLHARGRRAAHRQAAKSTDRWMDGWMDRPGLLPHLDHVAELLPVQPRGKRSTHSIYCGIHGLRVVLDQPRLQRRPQKSAGNRGWRHGKGANEETGGGGTARERMRLNTTEKERLPSGDCLGGDSLEKAPSSSSAFSSWVPTCLAELPAPGLSIPVPQTCPSIPVPHTRRSNQPRPLTPQPLPADHLSVYPLPLAPWPLPAGPPPRVP